MQCKEIQSELWLPHTTGCAGRRSNSLNISSNYTVEKLSSWKKMWKPKASTSISSLHFLPHFVTPSTEKEVIDHPNFEKTIVTTTKKIRIYPKNCEAKQQLIDNCDVTRRAYNLSVEVYIKADLEYNVWNENKSGLIPKCKSVYEIRLDTREKVRLECESRNAHFGSNVHADAVREAGRTRSQIMRLRKEYANTPPAVRLEKEMEWPEYHFRSFKNPKQGFIIQRLPLRQTLEKLFNITESIPDESYGSQARVLNQHGRWFLLVATKTILPAFDYDNQGSKICSIDPGLRTFATTFSTTVSVVKYGEQYFSNKIMPLLLTLDKHISAIKKLRNMFDEDNPIQWMSDAIRSVQKKINKLRYRIENLVRDIHWRVANDIVQEHDIIIMPHFETLQMVEKKRNRVLRNKSVRNMTQMSFFKFGQILSWVAKKHGSFVFRVNEAYTSKTETWSGKIHNKLGGSKTISDGNIRVDRDISGARNILLRTATRYGAMG